MPPKTREEVRHTLLVNRILDRLEEHYENTREVPENWWSLWDAQFLMSNYPQYNFTDDELDRASEVAIQQFYEDNPHAVGDYTQFFVMDIVDDILNTVTNIVYDGVPGSGGHGKSPDGLDHQSE